MLVSRFRGLTAKTLSLKCLDLHIVYLDPGACTSVYQCVPIPYAINIEIGRMGWSTVVLRLDP